MATVKYETTPENTKQALRLFRFCGWRIKVWEQGGEYHVEYCDDKSSYVTVEPGGYVPFSYRTAEEAQLHAVVLIAEKMGLNIPGKVRI